MAWLTGNDLKNDWLIGTGAADTIKGFGGNDTLKGGGGADYIDGGAGIDTAMYVDSWTGVYVDLGTGRGSYGTAEGDTLVSIENLYGSSYDDSLMGSEGANELRGLDGNDYLNARGGNDVLDGGWGDDILQGGTGGDYLMGGEGYDFAAYTVSAGGVWVSLATGSGYGGDAQGDYLSGIEGLYDSWYDDVLIGNAADNTFYASYGNDGLYGGAGNDGMMGGVGNDSLSGEAGNDHLYGEAGDDWLSGGTGADVLSGGDGYDWADYSFSSAGVIVSLATGAGYTGDAQGDYLTGVEGLYGSYYNDVFYGDAADNTVYAGAGSDTLQGDTGQDKLNGEDGNDWLFGGADYDQLFGGAGNDWLEGGAGTDTMTGGIGADTFAWSALSDLQTNWPDYIYDFNRAEGDRLDLSALDANSQMAGNQAFHFIGTAEFSGAPGEIRYYHWNGETILQIQTDSTPAIEGAIRMLGTFTPDASWFAL